MSDLMAGIQAGELGSLLILYAFLATGLFIILIIKLGQVLSGVPILILSIILADLAFVVIAPEWYMRFIVVQAALAALLIVGRIIASAERHHIIIGEQESHEVGPAALIAMMKGMDTPAVRHENARALTTQIKDEADYRRMLGEIHNRDALGVDHEST